MVIYAYLVTEINNATLSISIRQFVQIKILKLQMAATLSFENNKIKMLFAI